MQTQPDAKFIKTLRKMVKNHTKNCLTKWAYTGHDDNEFLLDVFKSEQKIVEFVMREKPCQ